MSATMRDVAKGMNLSITTVSFINQTASEMTRNLRRLLVDVLQHTINEQQMIEFIPELIIRESTSGLEESNDAS